MKIRVVLCLALLAGVVVLLLRNQLPNSSPKVASPATAVRSDPRQSSAALPTPRGTVATSQSTTSPADVALPLSLETLWDKPVAEPRFAAFKEWTSRYQEAATVEAKAALEAEGVALARARLTAMADLIQSNPERALQLAVPLEVREGLPAAVASLLEESINTRGDLEVMGVLPVKGSTESVPPVVRAAMIGGIRYEVFTFGKGLEFVTKQNVPLNGIVVPASALSQPLGRSVSRREEYLMALGEPMRQVTERSRLARALAASPVCQISGQPTTVAGEQGGVIETFCGPAHLRQWAASGNGDLTTPAGTQGLPIAESSYTEGRKRMLLMRPIWSDYTGGMTTNDALTHFQNFSNYMYEMSQGQMRLAPLGKGSAITPPMLLPGLVTNYDNTGLGKLYNTCRDVARTNFNYDLTQFDFTYVCTAGRPAASYAGLAFVGGVGFHLANSYWDSPVASHEFGHNLGLNHAHFWDTSLGSIIGAGQNVEYGDNNDPMGGGGSPNSYNSRYKNYLGWIRDTDVADLNVTGSGLYRLYALDLDNSVGLRGLKFARDGSQNFWLNFRQRKTSKKALMNGAQLLWTGNGNQGSYLLDVRLKGDADDNAIVIGQTFSDVSKGFHVTPVGKGRTFPESLDVRVNVGSFPGNLPPVANIVATPPPGGTGGHTLAAFASDPNGDPLAYFWDFGDGDYSVDNSAITTHNFAATGEFTVQCTISDMKGGTCRRSVIVRTGNPSTFRIAGHVLDQQNRPMAGMRVTTSSGKIVYTDSDGSYTITGLAAGNHNISVIEPVSGSFSFLHPSFNTPVSVGPNFAGADFIGVPGTLDIYTPLVARAASGWRFLDNGTDQGTGWVQPGFIDSSWGTGTAPLGYPSGGLINTVINDGPDTDRFITYYFRRQFTVSDPSIYTNVVLESVRDDGFAVYLNGTEIFRDNLVTNANYLTRATDNSPADAYQQTPVNRALLQPGVNYLAAEVHQVLPTSSDILFDAALSGLNVSNVTGFKFVYVSSPADGTILTAPSQVAVIATAFSGAAPVSLVEFFVDGAKIGEDAAAPYGLAWIGPTLGTHALTAVASLSGSGMITSAPVTVTIVSPAVATVRITSPTNGAAIALPANIAVDATATVGAVNPAPVASVQFFADGNSLGTDLSAPYSAVLTGVTPGARQLVAVSTDTLGNSVTSSPVNISLVKPAVGSQLISFGDVWKYLDDGSNQGSAWAARNFDDRTWMAGPARLGYGGDGEITSVSSGTNANQRYITTYFRRSFVLANPAAFSGLLLRLVRDDGAVVYLNGIEVFRDNLQAGAVNWNSLAAATINAPGETTPVEVTLGTGSLLAGTNVIAVEVHQAAANSSDLGFDLALEGLNPPTPAAEIYFTEPANGAHFNSPAQVGLLVYAANGAGDSPLSVTYYADGTFVGTGLAGPAFSQVWSNAPEGSHVLQAIADWGAGVTVTSAPVNIVVGPAPVRIQPLLTTFVPLNSTWRYWDNVAPVAGGWQNVGFNDSAWPQGAARLGWGLDGEATPLTPGRMTVYFRRVFPFPSSANGTFTELIFNIARDDGAVVYLNGTEIFRSNMPDGEVTPATFASTTINTPDETAYVEHVIPTAGSGLQSTGNVIAVELHQSSANSSDGGFELQMAAYGTTEPRVYIASPAEGAAYSASSNVVNVEAFARGSGGSTVSKVEFFGNTAKLGELNSAPWRLAWTNAPVGIHVLTARSTDSTGLVLDSSPLQIVVGRDPVATTFITSNSVWRYLDTGGNAGTAWAGTNYNDNSWKTGQTRLGYGSDGETQPAVSYGPSASSKYITTYFRRKFVVPAGAIYTNLTFKLVRDDGAVVWLNGQELYRSNMQPPPIPISYLSNALSAVSSTDEQTFFVTSLAVTNLHVGTNVLGVEIHQSAPDSSDLGFNLEVTGRGYSDDSAPPLLAIVLADGQVELSWPSTATGWSLLTALTIDTPPGEWFAVAGQPLEISGRFVVTVAPSFATQCFRLGRP